MKGVAERRAVLTKQLVEVEKHHFQFIKIYRELAKAGE